MTIDFFKKHAWQRGEVDWHFLVIFDKEPGIEEFAEKYKQPLDHPGLHTPIPAEWLHMTILRVGPITEISDEQMDKVCQLIQEQSRGLIMPELSLNSPWSWSGSVCVHVDPEDEIKKLYGITASACNQILDYETDTPEKFIPHVTLAYPKDTEDDAEIVRQIEQSQIEPFTFKPTELCLVKQTQTPPYYQWEVVKRLRLLS